MWPLQSKEVIQVSERSFMILQKTHRLALLVLAISTALSAQTSRGTVTGLVTDPQKASVAGAKVDLTATNTNITRSTETNDSGLFRFDAVDPGQYKLSVKSPGL